MTHTKKDALGQNSDATCSKHPALNINRLRIKPSLMYIFFVPCSSNPDGWLSTPFYVSACEENSEYQTIFCCMKMNTQQKVCQSERFFV